VGAFGWTKLVLVDFLVPIAWPAVALASVLILKKQIRSAVQQLADSLGHLARRVSEAGIGSALVKFDSLQSEIEVKQSPLQENSGAS
jgi:hypothetical protein